LTAEQTSQPFKKTSEISPPLVGGEFAWDAICFKWFIKNASPFERYQLFTPIVRVGKVIHPFLFG
jgi:hypothetical protein